MSESEARPRPWIRRRAGWLLAAAALVALGADAGYQVYAARIAHRNAAAVVTSKRNAAKIGRLTKAQCGTTQLFYDLFNALAEDSSPHFGSPPGRIVPGARVRLIEQLYNAERQSAAPLRKQGCQIRVPPRPAVP